MVRAPMPIQSGTVSFARFRSEPAGARTDAKRWLLRGLRKKAFEPLVARKPEDDRAAGFVELEDHDATGFEAGLFQGEHALFYAAAVLSLVVYSYPLPLGLLPL